MRRDLIPVLLAAAALLSTAAASGAAQCTLQTPSCPGPNNLLATFGANVSPQRLPANEYVPVRWNAFGKVSTRDGTHPSALREIVLDVDKDVRIDSRGYPICKRRRIEPLNSEAAAKACAKALVGRGEATVELAFPESTPISLSSQLLAFNVGETKLLIHAFIPIPTPSAILTVVEVRRKGTGLHAIARIPVLTEGYGSLIDFKFKLEKKYGYVEAKCPDGVFKANVSKLLFRNEARVPGVAAQTVMKGGLAVPCTPKG